MYGFRFANPEWIHALWLVIALVALLVWLDRRGRTVLERFVGSPMQARLARRLPPGRRWLSIGLWGLTGVLLVVALMRPQWGLVFHRTPRVGAQIMVCLDVSKSMLAEDTAPNRLGRAKAEIADLLSYLDGDQVGLIVFAGRATVACPLTPDFGFFRLVLDGVGPHSVGRGGTRLEEPIRKAVAGFRGESNVSRAILLVTDGEDHDSFPDAAAREAAERGIKIIAIGFGDEAGSEVAVTDPDTGVRTPLRDASGQPVITRLDGETLREIALATEGVYVPAGTGALDLESIYNAHVAPLTRGQLDDRGHAVRRDGFQWAVLLALISFIGSVAVASGSTAGGEVRPPATSTAVSRTSAAAAWFLAVGVTLAHAMPPAASAQDMDSQGPPDLSAQEPVPSTEPVPSQTIPSAAGGTVDSSEAAMQDEDVEDPRLAYNQALAILAKEPDRAERLLTAARRSSGVDGEVRFRATYNLGWVEVQRADAVLQEDPSAALEHLRSAADWFRDAVRLQPEHRDARHNLEVVLRRMMELADSLREQDERDLAQQLDDLIDQQRALVAQASEVVGAAASLDDSNAAEAFRTDYRRLAVTQRKLLSDAQAVAQPAREELQALEGKGEDETQPQDRLRIAQLQGVQVYLNQAQQRMGQTRSQLRRSQGERAFRRGSAALDDLKRARDQLRDPVQVLGVLIQDATETTQLTAAAAADASTAPPAIAPAETVSEVPAWLTREYLEQSQQSLSERTAELTDRLAAGLEQSGAQAAGPPTMEQQQQDAQVQRVLDRIQAAMPFLKEASEAFEQARLQLSENALEPANQQQLRGLTALHQAREYFLDLRGLIELAHGTQAQIHSLLASALPKEPDPDDTPEPSAEADRQEPESASESPDAESPDTESPDTESPDTESPDTESPDTESPDTESPDTESPDTESPDTESPAPELPPEQLAAMAPAVREIQAANLERTDRLAQLLEESLEALPEAAETDPAAPNAPNTPSEPSPEAAERQRLEMASRWLALCQAEMRQVNERLDELERLQAAGDESEPAVPATVPEDRIETADTVPTEAEDGSSQPETSEPETSEPETSQPDDAGTESASEAPPSETPGPEAEKRPVPQAWIAATEHADRAVSHLADLRRLFYSLVEHLQETAQRQLDLNDETERVGTLNSGDELPAQLAPLTSRQAELGAIAEQIGTALREQSEQAPPPPTGDSPDDTPDSSAGEADPQQMQEMTERLAEAAELVEAGSEAMQRAFQGMSAEVPEIEPVRQEQDLALQKLAEALARLAPQQPPPEDQPQTSPEDSQDSQQAQAGEPSQADQEGADPERLLQAVRDREAQRMKDRNRQRADFEPVDKDW